MNQRLTGAELHLAPDVVAFNQVVKDSASLDDDEGRPSQMILPDDL